MQFTTTLTTLLTILTSITMVLSANLPRIAIDNLTPRGPIGYTDADFEGTPQEIWTKVKARQAEMGLLDKRGELEARDPVCLLSFHFHSLLYKK